MELKTKLALAGLAALAVTTVWIVSDPAPQPEAPAKLALAGEPGRDVATDSSAPFEVTKALAEHRETAFELGSQSPAPTDADGRRRISGIVIDVTGKRLPGVDLVFQSGEPARTDPAIRGSSDSSGGFELAADSGHGGRIDPVSSDWVVVYKPELRVPDPIDGYVLVLARPRRIHGIVRDNPGTQINGAEVWLSYMVPNPDLGIALWGTRPPKPSSRRDSPGFGFFGDPLRRSIGVDLGITELQDQGWNTRSSSSGSFLIQGVDSLPNARICASAPSYDDGEAELQEHVDEVVVVLHKRSDVRSGEIYGRVVDPNGSAVSQACLRFGAHQAVSDEQGEFVIGIGEQGPGTRLIAFHQDWRPVLQPCLSKSPSDRDAWPDPLILQFTRPQTGIAGVVVDLAGRPVPGVEVLTLDPLSWNQMFGTLGEPPVRGGDGSERVLGDESVTTDSNGQFSVAASAERRTRLLVRDRQSLEIAVSEPVPASTKGASIVLGDAGGRCRLAGRLMDLRGTPIVDAAISATRTVHGSGPRAEVRLETGQVRTDAAGQFELRDMSRDIEGFIIWPDRTTPTNVVPIDPLTPRDQLIVRVGRMARVQIELHTAGLAADSAAFLDGSGAVLPVGATIGKHGWSGGDRRGIGDGKSEVMIVSEEATTLVLRLLGQEVARVPIALDPATVTLVRP
jgi:hypothetical protein